MAIVLRHLLHEWVVHYNTGRPHMALGMVWGGQGRPHVGCPL